MFKRNLYMDMAVHLYVTTRPLWIHTSLNDIQKSLFSRFFDLKIEFFSLPDFMWWLSFLKQCFFIWTNIHLFSSRPNGSKSKSVDSWSRFKVTCTGALAMTYCTISEYCTIIAFNKSGRLSSPLPSDKLLIIEEESIPSTLLCKKSIECWAKDMLLSPWTPKWSSSSIYLWHCSLSSTYRPSAGSRAIIFLLIR